MNTFHCSFHYDDAVYITNNFPIKNISNLYNIWKICPCRFVTFFSIALNYHFDHFNVFSYHLFNLAVHLGTAIFVWWLLLLTLSTPAMKENKITQQANPIALLAGLVFVTHPIQTEAVTFIWQRAASMTTFFYLASLCLYVKSRLLQASVTSSGRASIYYIGALIVAIVAMFTKEISITLPVMVVFYEFSFFEKKGSLNWRRLCPFLLTLLIIPVTLLLTKSDRFQEIHDVTTGPGAISPWQYLLTQFRVIVTYIRLVFLPVNQNIDYDYHLSKSIFELPALISFLFLTGILISAQRLFLKYRLVAFSIFWFFLTLLPESSFLPQKDLIFEHRLYLPMVGYSIFLVSSLYYLLDKNNIKMMVVALTMIIICNSVLTYQRNKVWRDDLTLWDDTVSKSPHKARPYVDRGMAFLGQGEFAKAIADLNKAIEINPGYAEGYYNRGYIYDVQGKISGALSDYSKAIAMNPNYAVAYQNRSNVYAIQGDFARAVADINKTIELKPNDAEAYNNRGSIYARQGEFTQALLDYNKALEIDHDYEAAYNNRRAVYKALGH